MLKTNAILEIVKETRSYKFIIPENASLGEIHDVLFQMKTFIIDKINEIAAMQKPQDPEIEKQGI